MNEGVTINEGLTGELPTHSCVAIDVIAIYGKSDLHADSTHRIVSARPACCADS